MYYFMALAAIAIADQSRLRLLTLATQTATTQVIIPAITQAATAAFLAVVDRLVAAEHREAGDYNGSKQV
jgi:hypothetical protein